MIPLKLSNVFKSSLFVPSRDYSSLHICFHWKIYRNILFSILPQTTVSWSGFTKIIATRRMPYCRHCRPDTACFILLQPWMNGKDIRNYYQYSGPAAVRSNIGFSVNRRGHVIEIDQPSQFPIHRSAKSYRLVYDLRVMFRALNRMEF